MTLKNFYKLFILLVLSIPLQAQVIVDDKGTIDYASPKEFEIQKIAFSGVHYSDTNICKLLTGLYEGETLQIPGDKITKAVQNLWKQGLFDDIKLYATKIEDKKIWLEIQLKEHPRLSTVSS